VHWRRHHQSDSLGRQGFNSRSSMRHQDKRVPTRQSQEGQPWAQRKRLAERRAAAVSDGGVCTPTTSYNVTKMEECNSNFNRNSESMQAYRRGLAAPGG
jgi:hypothetical protein